MPDVLFGQLVSYFFFLSMFFYILTTMVTLKGCNMHSTRRGMEWKDWGEPTKRKMGPNDMIHVVWAISTCSFFYSCFFSIIHNYKYYRH